MGRSVIVIVALLILSGCSGGPLSEAPARPSTAPEVLEVGWSMYGFKNGLVTFDLKARRMTSPSFPDNGWSPKCDTEISIADAKLLAEAVRDADLYDFSPQLSWFSETRKLTDGEMPWGVIVFVKWSDKEASYYLPFVDLEKPMGRIPAGAKSKYRALERLYFRTMPHVQNHYEEPIPVPAKQAEKEFPAAWRSLAEKWNAVLPRGLGRINPELQSSP